MSLDTFKSAWIERPQWSRHIIHHIILVWVQSALSLSYRPCWRPSWQWRIRTVDQRRMYISSFRIILWHANHCWRHTTPYLYHIIMKTSCFSSPRSARSFLIPTRQYKHLCSHIMWGKKAVKLMLSLEWFCKVAYVRYDRLHNDLYVFFITKR